MAGLREPGLPWRAFPRTLLLLTLLLSFFALTTAHPAVLQYSDCFSSTNTTQKLSISTVYAQFFPDGPNGAYLNFTVIGSTPEEIVAASDGANPVASASCFLFSLRTKVPSLIRSRNSPSDPIHDHRTTDLPNHQQQQQLLLLLHPPLRQRQHLRCPRRPSQQREQRPALWRTSDGCRRAGSAASFVTDVHFREPFFDTSRSPRVARQASQSNEKLRRKLSVI